MAPSFGDLEYWNTRFSREENFDWLADFKVLEPWLQKTINGWNNARTHKTIADGQRDGEEQGYKRTSRPRILHIGCGSSSLSFQLRGLVGSAEQIHNCDYSDVVVRRQRRREKELLAGNAEEEKRGVSRWSTLDLLDLRQIVEVRKSGGGCGGGQYDVIVDKSTSDAISCAEDVEVCLPYRVNIDTTASVHDTSLEKASVYPPYVLAIHLAYLATPGCRWVVLSYSSSRFEGWEDEGLPKGLPHPRELWRMIRHEKIIQPPDPEDKVHRPPETHHLYILERTEVELKEV